MNEDWQKFFTEHEMNPKRRYGQRTRKQTIGSQRRVIRGMLVEFTGFNGEIGENLDGQKAKQWVVYGNQIDMK